MTRGVIAYRRFAALDGLRGLAALIVVVHHSFLIAPSLASAYDDSASTHPEGWAWWLTYTPLHLLWAGPEAVCLFFVLSGFVLTLPYTGGRAATWRAYYPRRLLRLYLPVWGAVVVTLLLQAVVQPKAGAGLSWWLNEHATPITAGRLSHDLLLVNGSEFINTPLWSLRWEVVFSLLLPVYLFAARTAVRWWMGAALVVVAAVAAFDVLSVESLLYLPMFAIGVLMANIRDHLASLAARISTAGWVALVAAGLLLMVGDWLLPELPGRRALPLVGAALLVFAFLASRRAIWLGSSPPAQWLGRRSFSLYLIHEPIVVAIAFVLRTTNHWLVLAISLPLSLFAASLFYWAVEGPAHRLSSYVGRRIGDRPRPSVPVEAPLQRVDEQRAE